MNHTQNYNLNQWEAGDRVLRTDFNADNAKLDAAIKAVDQRVDGKADASALAALVQTVAGKGNCQIVTGQYTGNGLYNQSSPNALSFSKQPVLLLISGYDTAIFSYSSTHGYMLQNGTSEMLNVSWSGNNVSWYSTRGSYYQMNESKKVYYYVAFIAV